MSEIGCTSGCGILVVLLAGIIYQLFRIRLRIDGEVLQITQYGGLWPFIGAALIGSALIGWDRGSLVWAIGSGVLALVALAAQPLWISTNINRDYRTFTNRQIQLLKIRRYKLSLDEITGVEMTEASDLKGRSSANVYVKTTDGRTINLLVNQPSGDSRFGRRGYGRTLDAIKEINNFLLNKSTPQTIYSGERE